MLPRQVDMLHYLAMPPRRVDYGVFEKTGAGCFFLNTNDVFCMLVMALASAKNDMLERQHDVHACHDISIGYV
jgi:hypothetical protein